MNLLKFFRRNDTERRSSGMWRVLTDFFDLGTKSKAGENVTPESALRVAAVYACVRVLAETLAAMPLHLMERQSGGKRVRAEQHPLYRVLHSQPNRWQTRFEFIEMMMGHLALRQNAYARIVPGELGAVTELIPLHPGRMRVERLENGRLRYMYRDPDSHAETPYTQDEIFHVRGMSLDGLAGLSTVMLSTEPIGLALATESYGARFFSNNAKPGGVLSTDRILDDAARKNLRETWQAAHTSENVHKVAVLEAGLKWQQVGMTSEDAQFLETRRYQNEEIARIFRVPQHMIGHLERSTNNNIEQQSLEFVTYTMLPWIVRWEQAIMRDLIVEPERYYAKFNFDALLRADSASRAQFYKEMFGIGVYSINDILDLEDRNPIEGGDRHFIAANNLVPLDRIDEFLGVNKPVEPSEDDSELETLQSEAGRMRAELMEAARELGGLRAQYDAMRAACDNERTQATRFGEEVRQLSAVVESKDKEVQKRSAALKQLEAKIAEYQKTMEQTTQELTAYQERQQAAQEITRKTITEAARKLIRWEIDAMQRATGKANFLAEMDKFYDDHEGRLSSALESSVQLYSVLTGDAVDLPGMVRGYVQDSRESLLLAAECEAEVLASQVAACVSSWEDRAAYFVDSLTQFITSTHSEED